MNGYEDYDGDLAAYDPDDFAKRPDVVEELEDRAEDDR